MSNMRIVARAGVAGLAAAALLTTGTVNAQADPTSFKPYAAVGSDTTQDVWNGLTLGTTPAMANIGSYNAFGSATIQTKPAGATFNRPAGSGAGVRALSAVWDPGYASHDYQGVALVNKEVDFARSSSGPTAGTGLTYLPFARDAVSVAVKLFTAGNTRTSFTTAQLAAIYGGADDNTAGTGVTYQASSGKPIVGGKVYSPVLPQGSSGTRSFFQSAIGITTSDLGPYVEPTPSTLPENDGTVLTAEGALIPFSAAQWIAQQRGQIANTTAGLKIATLNSQVAVAGAGASASPGPLFGAKTPAGTYSTPPTPGVGVFNRDTYNVVPTAFLTGTTNQQLLVTRLTGSGGGQIGSTKSMRVITSYGFGNLAYLGDTSFYRDGAFLH